jgi:hypothetical protein
MSSKALEVAFPRGGKKLHDVRRGSAYCICHPLYERAPITGIDIRFFS